MSSQINVVSPASSATYPTQSVSYSGTAGSTSGWSSGPAAVLVTVTTDAYVAVGAGVTATTANTFVPAYTPIPFQVPNVAGPWRVSAIQLSAAGTVYASPITA